MEVGLDLVSDVLTSESADEEERDQNDRNRDQDIDGDDVKEMKDKGQSCSDDSSDGVPVKSEKSFCAQEDASLRVACPTLALQPRGHARAGFFDVDRARGTRVVGGSAL
jgi:hypothetical protein